MEGGEEFVEFVDGFLELGGVVVGVGGDGEGGDGGGVLGGGGDFVGELLSGDFAGGAGGAFGSGLALGDAAISGIGALLLACFWGGASVFGGAYRISRMRKGIGIWIGFLYDDGDDWLCERNLVTCLRCFWVMAQKRRSSMSRMTQLNWGRTSFR